MSTEVWIKAAKLIASAIFGALAIFYAVTAFFGSAEVSNTAQRESHWQRSQLEIVRLLRDGEWDELEAEYTALHRKYLAGEARWNEVSSAFGAFDFADPDLQPAFESWVNAAPDSFVAHAARGLYLSNLGFATRGTQYISKTHPEQIRGMVRYFRMAVPELKRAIALNPAAVQAYARMMEISRSRGDYGGVWQTYVMGYFRSADATALTDVMADTLQEKWGADPSHRLWFSRFAQIAGLFDSGFIVVRENEEFQKAEAAELDQDYETARELWTKILTTNKNASIYLQRARVLRRMGRNEAALADALTAIEKKPRYAAAHALAGKILIRSNQLEKALSYLDTAIDLVPYRPAYLVDRAFVLAALKRFDEVERDLDNALVFGQWIPDVHWARAHYLKDPRANPDKAKKSFVRLLEFDPDNERYLRAFTYWLHLKQDCDFFPYNERLLNICLRTQSCGRRDLDRHIWSANRAREPGQCKSVPDISRYYDRYLHALTNLDDVAVAGLKLGQGRKEIKAAHPDAVITPVVIGQMTKPVGYQAKWGSVHLPPRVIVHMTTDDRINGIQVIDTLDPSVDVAAAEKRFVEKYGPPDSRRTNRRVELEYRQPGKTTRYAKTLTITLIPFKVEKPADGKKAGDVVRVILQLSDYELTEIAAARAAEIAREDAKDRGTVKNEGARR